MDWTALMDHPPSRSGPSGDDFVGIGRASLSQLRHVPNDRVRNGRGMTRTVTHLLYAAFLVWASANSATAQDIPTSPRSLAAIQRVTSGLEGDLAAMGLRLGAPIFIRIVKSSRELQLWVEGDQAEFHLFRIYPICRYSGSLGPKLREGDMQSPEGFYFVTPRQLNPSSAFHLSFDLGFPNVPIRLMQVARRWVADRGSTGGM